VYLIICKVQYSFKFTQLHIYTIVHFFARMDFLVEAEA